MASRAEAIREYLHQVGEARIHDIVDTLGYLVPPEEAFHRWRRGKQNRSNTGAHTSQTAQVASGKREILLQTLRSMCRETGHVQVNDGVYSLTTKGVRQCLKESEPLGALLEQVIARLNVLGTRDATLNQRHLAELQRVLARLNVKVGR